MKLPETETKLIALTTILAFCALTAMICAHEVQSTKRAAIAAGLVEKATERGTIWVRAESGCGAEK